VLLLCSWKSLLCRACSRTKGWHDIWKRHTQRFRHPAACFREGKLGKRGGE
ncbi:unnamed protein product, partial [Ectocarpus sp. 4 AP-2014]